MFAAFAPVSQAQAQLTDAQLKQSERFIEKLADNGIAFLTDEDLTKAQQVGAFEHLIAKNFDMRTIGRFAMGRNWRAAKPTQQKEYLNLFEDMVIKTYARRFEDYGGQELKVTNSRVQGKRDAIVASVISQPSGPDVRVDWRIRVKNGDYKVIDILVEGVSMALTYRSDFSSVIQRGGGDVGILIAHLRDH